MCIVGADPEFFQRWDWGECFWGKFMFIHVMNYILANKSNKYENHILSVFLFHMVFLHNN